MLPVKRVVYRPTIETTGTVAFDGNLSTQVLAAISGPVVRILVEPGAEVHRGDLLAVVSSPDFSAAVSAFRKAQAAAVQAQKVAELNDALFKSDGIARRDMEQSKVDALAAAADRDAALQQLRALGIDSATIESLRNDRPVGAVQGAIRAPIDGTVVEKLITPGQLLQAGSTPCFTIADLSHVWVFANVFEADLASVAKGDRADITTAAAPRPDLPRHRRLCGRARRSRDAGDVGASRGPQCRPRRSGATCTCRSRLHSSLAAPRSLRAGERRAPR